MDEILEKLARKEALANALLAQATFASANGMSRHAEVCYDRADNLRKEIEAEFEALCNQPA